LTYSRVSDRVLLQLPCRSRLTCSLLLTLLLGSCATPPQTAALLQQQVPQPTPATVSAQHGPGLRTLSAQITDLPFFPQDDYQCGPAALATMLQHAGIQRSPEAL